MVKKNGLRLLNKTVITNAADILSNIATKISHTIATNYPKNVGLATTTSIASEDRKTGSNLTFTDTTEQSAATFAEILKSRCFERSPAPFPLIEDILKRHFQLQSQLIIALDRTQWEPMPKIRATLITKSVFF